MNEIRNARLLELVTLADDIVEIDELSGYLTDPDPEVRRVAVTTAVEVARAGAALALSPRLVDDDPVVRASAVGALFELRELTESGPELAAELQPATVHNDADVRAAALRILRDQRLGTVEQFVTATKDQHPAVRVEAVKGLGSLDQPALAGKSASDKEPFVRLAVAKTLGRLRDAGGQRELADLAADEDIHVRAAALEALAGAVWRGDLTAIVDEALKNPNWEVRRGALLGLAGASAEVATPRLRAGLEDENADVRKAAVQTATPWLGETAELASAVKNVVDDPDADVRGYARIALR